MKNARLFKKHLYDYWFVCVFFVHRRWQTVLRWIQSILLWWSPDRRGTEGAFSHNWHPQHRVSYFILCPFLTSMRYVTLEIVALKNCFYSLFPAMWTLMNSVVSGTSGFISCYNIIIIIPVIALPRSISHFSHPGLKCSLTFSQNKERSLLDVVMWLHVKKPPQAAWLRCHTSAASTKHPQPCPSYLNHKNASFFMVW